MTNCQLILGINGFNYYDVNMTYKSIKLKKSSGFTLVELMIVVAIIGILAAVAYPSYTKYVQKSKRTEAMVALMQAAQIQEKYYSQNLKYAFNPATLYNNAGLGATFDTENTLYAIDVDGFEDAAQATAATAVADPCVSFTIKATAKGSQIHDATCRVFTLTNTGKKKSYAYSGGTLNTTANPVGTCW